jgi:L-lactate dehydrogenase complex protein LldF
MPTNTANQFIENAAAALKNTTLQTALDRGTTHGLNGRISAMAEVTDATALREQGRAARMRALNALPDLLEKFEANITARGAQVLWATDAEECNRLVLEIAQKHDVRRIVKSKSMATEETGLNPVLEAAGLRVVETDLGEFIVQLAGDRPSHIIMPLMHRTQDEIRDLLVERLHMPYTDDPAQMTAFARAYLRQEFLSADMGITGANFLIAETGSAAIVTNEGNGRMCSSLPRVHVVVVGIEKVIDTVEDFGTLVQLLPRTGTGQRLSVYVHLMNGPARPEDPDGPEFMYVILLDNGRSRIFNSSYAESLLCIRCGACLNVCPVYQNVGGHAYGWVYSGPIGAVLTPLMTGLPNAAPLPYASSLCGACKDACPVMVELPDMLLRLRGDLVSIEQTDPVLGMAIKGWARMMQSPRLYALGGMAARVGTQVMAGREGAIHNLPGPLGNWTRYRDFPPFAPQSFHQLWREREQGS